ncbi:MULTISPECIES: accessory gene regulator B family protein [Cohnella]|jgi:accessory gene regulator B|uniref:accessory gene regulator B family protein n=1 Tax=Cohnella TaxID=329857 RepID=UPI00036CDE3C|nr:MULTISPECIES: accessory gene regulator B family protein [Cohnella]REK65433.1 MAG: accessory regulator AgrB [Cohnella sp.]
MIDFLASRMAVAIKRSAVDHPASVDVLTFSLIAILNGLSIVLITMAVSLFTGRPGEAATALAGYALLRQMSGGIHLKSGDLCVVVSVLGLTAMSFADFNGTAVAAMTGAAALLALAFAPSRIDGQTRIPRRYYPLLKVLSVLTVSSNFLIMSPVLAAAFLVQCLTLIRGRR